MVFKLNFLTKEQKIKFRDENFNNLLKPRRFFVILGAILYLLFAILDKFLIENYHLFKFFLILRLSITSVGFIIIFVSYTKFCKQYLENLLSFLVIFAAFFIIIMIILSDGIVHLTYFTGLILVLLFNYSFLFPFYKGFFNGWVIIVIYNIMLLSFKDDIKIAVLQNFFLVGFNFLGVFFAYYLERKNGENYLLNSKLTNAYEKIKELSLIDPLTGIKNRRFFKEVVSEDLEKIFQLSKGDIFTKREIKNSVYGVLILDIDHFKKVNDQLGHDAGDRVLKQFSNLVENSIRKDDILIRWGGEEFLVILKNVKKSKIKEIAYNLKNIIKNYKFVYNDKGEFIYKTCSIGGIAFPFDNISVENCIKLADYGLYNSKNSGRDRVSYILKNQDGEIDIDNIDQNFENGILKMVVKE